MDQQLFRIHFQASDPIISDDTIFMYYIVLWEDDEDNTSFISSSKSITETESSSSHPMLSAEGIFLKRIQNPLTILMKSIVLEEINTEINNIFMEVDNVSIIVSKEVPRILRRFFNC